jgi:hypothetical protein
MNQHLNQPILIRAQPAKASALSASPGSIAQCALEQALEALYLAREHVTVHTGGPWQKVEAECHAAIASLLRAVPEVIAATSGDAGEARLAQVAAPSPLSPSAQATIGRWVAADMDKAVANGANSVSMPDELVEIAAWLNGLADAADDAADEATDEVRRISESAALPGASIRERIRA